MWSWKAYVNFVSDIVVSGFTTTIVVSLKYLRSQIDPNSISKLELRPLIKADLELIAPDILWKPELGSNGIRGMVSNWLNSFMEIGNLMKR